jgi:hypothetical protein
MAIKGYYTANEIIDEALLSVGIEDRSRYPEAAMYFIRMFRDFKLFHVAQEKEAWLPINNLVYTVQYPDDAIKILEVGVSVNREIFTFTEAPNMVEPSDPIDRELRTSRDETQTTDRSPYSGYGAKGLNVEYYFNLDERNRRIILNRAAVDKTRYADRSEVLVRYVSHDVDSLDETRVGADAVNMLIAYVEWKLIAARPKEHTAQYRMEKKAEFQEAEASYRLLNIPDVGELMDVIYESSSQNVRL